MIATMKKLLTIFFAVLLISCKSCITEPTPKTELEKLPPATMEGKDTFGCLVNGKAWVTRVSTDVGAFYQSRVFQISAGIDEKERDQGITIAVLSGIMQGNSYDLSNDPEFEALYGGTRPVGICFYDDENTLIGQLTITKLDPINTIVSGLFEFTTFVSGCDTIRVTNGRFDVHYAN